MTKAQKIGYSIVGVVAAALLVVAGFFDLAIDDAIYQPGNVAALILEVIGVFPPFIIVSFTALTFFALSYIRKEQKFRMFAMVASVAVSLISWAVCGIVGLEEQISSKVISGLIGFGFGCLPTTLGCIFLPRIKENNLRKLFAFGIFAVIVAVVSSIVLINVLKWCWGRARYRIMEAAGDTAHNEFTSWYKLNFRIKHGYSSFPSGHTSAATNVFVLAALPEIFPSMKKNERAIFHLSGFFAFVVAYSRLVLGAHFLSDVVAGFVVSFFSYAVARFLLFGKGKPITLIIDGIEKTEIVENVDVSSNECALNDNPPVENGEQD